MIKGELFQDQNNPLAAIIVRMMIEYGDNFLTQENLQAVGSNCAYILQEYILEDPEDVELLSFE